MTDMSEQDADAESETVATDEGPGASEQGGDGDDQSGENREGLDDIAKQPSGDVDEIFKRIVEAVS